MLNWLQIRIYGFLLVSVSEHFKSGAVISHLGQVALAEDVLMLRYPFVTLLSIHEDLHVVSTKLDVAMGFLLSSLEDEMHAPSLMLCFP